MQQYCYKCMRPLGGSSVCGSCGYDNSAAQSASAPYHLRCGTMLHGRYLIGRVIGEGGFGITYIGLDATLTKRVAVKEFFPSGVVNRAASSSDSITVTQGREEFFKKGEERFLLEAKNVAAFSDEEGVVDVLDYFQENGTAYIVMEYLDGETLKDYVSRCGCFDPQTLIQLMLPIMRSLGYMHSKGIIHRDISPDNIMYTKRGKLKLMDFGSARYFTNEERKMSVILKQGFAPEEQYRQNGEQGPYTDVYALCATFYACITGRIPVGSLDRLASDTLVPPSRLGISIYPQQESALMHGLAVSAANRTRDMETLIKEFTAQPNAAPPVTQRPVTRTPPVNQAPVTQPMNFRQYNPPSGMYPPSGGTYSGSPQPAKKSKTPLIIIAVIAVLVIGGGVIAAIAIFGGGSGSGGTQSSSSTVYSSAQQSLSSSQSSRQLSAANSLYSSNGVFLLSDENIDTTDKSAEQKLTSYIEEYEGASGSTDELNYIARASGNTVVFEYYYKYALDDTQKQTLTNKVKTFLTSTQNIVKNVRTNSGVSNAQVVYAYFDIDGNLIACGVGAE